MRHPKTELIVPVRDRRKHRRIVTLKNFGILLIVLVVGFIGITVGSEIGGRPNGSFGRLVSGELPPESAPAQAPKVVAEAPVPDQTVADPMLVAPAAREQYLGETTSSAPPVVVPVSAPVAQPVQAGVAHGDVAIVGDGTGVSVVSNSSAPTHHLSGGIFRQQ